MPSKKATKARSAVTGKYVDKQTAKANPRETVTERDVHGRCVRLSKGDLMFIKRLFEYDPCRGTHEVSLARIAAKLDRAIAAFGKG